MYDLNRLRPSRFASKVRLGKDSDGGYVLLREHVESTRVLLSFGVATDWSFEEDFFRRKRGLAVLMFDASISFPLIFVKLASKLAKFDIPKALHYAGAALHYVSFIVLNPTVTFHRKFLAAATGRRDVTFDDVLRIPGPDAIGPHGAFVKLDIEGGEYDLLPAIARHAPLINGLVVELHDLDRMGRRMEEVMEALSADFVVSHVHANNYTGFVPDTRLPVTLEVTLVNRALAPAELLPDPGPFPDPVLDRPCDPAREDYLLNFS
jgi:hypothetical protein